MTARLLEGRPVAEAIWQRVEPVARAFAERAGREPCLGLVGGADEAAAAYARQIERQFGRRGLRVVHRESDGPHLTGTVAMLSAEQEIDATEQEVSDVIRSERYSRYPVYRETLDDVVGVFLAKDLWLRDLSHR